MVRYKSVQVCSILLVVFFSLPLIAEPLIAEKMSIKEQKEYKPTGISFCIDPNVGLIWDNLDPMFTITYKNAAGQTKTRKYQASIDTIGLKLDVSIRFNLVFFTDSANDYYESNKVLHLGTGIELGIAEAWGLGLIYAPFTNAPGGLLIINGNFGIGGNGLCLVQGGTLIPIS